MKFKELMPFLLKGAPLLASALGSPAAGMVTGLVASAFNADPHDMLNLQRTISTDPDSEEKLKQLECDHGDTIKSLLFDRSPSKIDLHIIVHYNDTESLNEQQA